MESRRRAPPVIAKILDVDENLTNKFCRWSGYFPVFRTVKRHSKSLEISCHGIPWFAGLIFFIIVTSSSSLRQIQVNLLFGLILDVIFIAVIKAYVRRRRPNKNRPDMFVTLSIDNFSFPSGHASRAALLTYFFMFLSPLPAFLIIPLIIWVTSVCISRVLLNRHYLLDVISGIFLGYMEGILLEYFWIGEPFANFLISWLSETYD
ncbi:hypothetical protein J437_LFUL017972 [Ladona fulva]|uniref:Phosphatidic acid phosphatase type 2/haloperoxidase domain-containing protein n=1 Tax=Ladona fulva TaxID=123851 RepID=A0A8K0P6U1_LADFU|nr:hypothetical protein J437_LFUL017972 [Ladona fulva]